MARHVVLRTARTYARDMAHLTRLRTAIIIDRRADQTAVRHIDHLLACLAELTSIANNDRRESA